MRYLLLIGMAIALHAQTSAQFVSKHYEAQQLQLQAGLLFEQLQKDLREDGWRPDVDLYILKEGGVNIPVIEINIAGQPDTVKQKGGAVHVNYRNYVTMWMFDKPVDKKLKDFLVSSMGGESWVEFTETKNCTVCIIPTELGSAKKEHKEVAALRTLLMGFLKKNSEKL